MKNFVMINISKKTGLSAILILVTIYSVMAQNDSGFGIKGGVNYNANGDYYNSISNTNNNPTGAIGYHIGIFGKLGDDIYFKPELMYTKTNSTYNTGNFKQQRIDAPVLVGVKIVEPLSVFAGPAFQYILDSDFENATINDIKNNFTIGLNFGVGLSFDSVGIDLRYERSFTDNEATILTNNSIVKIDKLDTRASQLILSLSVKL